MEPSRSQLVGPLGPWFHRRPGVTYRPTRARSSSKSRTRPFLVSDAARANSERASSTRPSLARKSPRTLGSRWYCCERGLGCQRIHQLEPRRRPVRHRHGDSAIQLDDGRGSELRQRVVQRHDPLPVRFLRRPRASVTGGDRALERVRAAGARPAPRLAGATRARAGSGGGPTGRGPDRAAGSARPTGRSVPRMRDAWISMSATRPWTSGSSGASPARMRPRRKASSHRPGRIQSSPARRRVALVEDEVDHLEHGRQPSGQLVPRGTSKGTRASARVRFARTIR